MSENYYGLYALVVLAIVMLFMGARAIDDTGSLRIGQGEPVREPTVVRTSGAPAEMMIRPTRSGSFLTRANFDGGRVDVLVDTGASFTTLTESDAQRAGILPRRSDYVHTFSTANGEVQAARGEVAMLEIGPAVFYDVEVFVIPDDKLAVSLLGMNVLRQFDRIEMTSDGLRLSI